MMNLSTQSWHTLWQTQQFFSGFLFRIFFFFLNKTMLKNIELNLECPYNENFSHCKDSFESGISITKKLQLPVLEDRVLNVVS